MRKFLLVLAAVAVIAAALLTPSYLWYRRTKGIVPAWVRLAGLDIKDHYPESQVPAQRLNEPLAYTSMTSASCCVHRLSTSGSAVKMLADAKQYDTPANLLRFLVGRGIARPLTPVNVPLRYTVDKDALENWLVDVAQRYNRAPQRPQPVVSTLSVSPGQSGLELDMNPSRERVIAALANLEDRTVRLALRERPAPPVDVKSLEELLAARLKQFPGIASVFLHHVPSGDEVAINADVAYGA
jgi:hypothetical protein